MFANRRRRQGEEGKEGGRGNEIGKERKGVGERRRKVKCSVYKERKEERGKRRKSIKKK